MTLRDDIANLKHPTLGYGVSQMLSDQHNTAIDAVLAVFDKHESEMDDRFMRATVCYDCCQGDHEHEGSSCNNYLEFACRCVMRP
jgi:hypothetical protein